MTETALFARWRHWLMAAALVLALPAWAGDNLFYGKDISDKGYGGDWRLTDHNGRKRTIADFRGRIVLIFFGYTHCPDFCPTTLVKMATVMKQLGPDAAKVQVLFVTIDPERDSEALLRNYVPVFDPSFLGLRGSDEETEKVTQDFKAHYQLMKYRGETLVDHTASGYLIDTKGKTRLLFSYTQTADQIAADVRTILAEG
ncbi:MAG: SCO family protein [Sulfuricella sp.]